MAKNVVKAVGLVFIINICVKLLGFGREMVIANGFGASFLTDAYLAAYTLPYMFQAILGYAFISAILPELSSCWAEEGDNERAYRLGSTLLNLIVGSMIALSLVGILAAKGLIWLTAPGLNPETFLLATELTRIIFPSMIFISAGMVVSAILNARYRFAAAALAPGMCSIIIILAVSLLAKGNIYVLAWGTLAGFAAFFLIQAVDLPHTGFRYRLCLDLKDPAVKRIMAKIVPIVLALSVSQIYILVNRIFASGLAEGSISALNYANKLMNLPLGVFVTAIITVAFPALAEKALQADRAALAKAVKRGLSMIIIVSFPSALGLMLLAGDIIRLLFESGSFTAESTLITTQALIPMAPGLIFLGISMLLVRVFFAMRQVKAPLLCGLFSVIVNVAVSFALVGPMGHAGLSLANTVASAVNALLLMYFLAKEVPFLRDGEVLRSVWLSLAGCVVIAIPIVLALVFWPAAGKPALVAEIIAVMAAAVGLYFAVLKVFRCPVLQDVKNSLSRRKK